MDMHGFVPLDPEGHVSEVRFAVVYVPRRNRSRFAASCVTVMESEQAAREAADPENKRYAARVMGPSKSSEGQSVYYRSEWL
jgi:hypothetical protein